MKSKGLDHFMMVKLCSTIPVVIQQGYLFELDGNWLPTSMKNDLKTSWLKKKT